MYKLYVSRHGYWEHWSTYQTLDHLVRAVFTLHRQQGIDDVKVEVVK